MPSIIAHIAPKGTALSEGAPSTFGHMWFTLVDEFSNYASYGFHPVVDGKAWMSGKVVKSDDNRYVNTSYNYERGISQEQYADIVRWAQKTKSDADNGKGRWEEYSGPWNSVVDFTWEVLKQGGLTDTPENGFQGFLIPQLNRWEMEKELLGKDPIAETIDQAFNTLITTARNWLPPSTRPTGPGPRRRGHQHQRHQARCPHPLRVMGVSWSTGATSATSRPTN